MSLRPSDIANQPEWSIEAAEELIGSLTGVLSARIVSRPGGEIEEVHVLTTEEVSPKQTVRNVESALLAHFELPVDHRKISVAQTSRPIPLTSPQEGRMAVVVERAERTPAGRILFRGHQMETDGNHQVRVTVSVEWQGESYEGSATATDFPRNRLEATAKATLRALEAAAAATGSDDESAFPGISLSLDGVKLLDAFDDRYVLVVINAIAGRDVVTLTGSCQVGRNLERSALLATLQATDRWVRGRLT